MIFFKDWLISASNELLAMQHDNKTRELRVVGEIPEDWNWTAIVKVDDYMDLIPMPRQEDGSLLVVLSASQLAFPGYYTIQLKGERADEIRHTNKTFSYVGDSFSGDENWPEIPSQFTDWEQQVKTQLAADLEVSRAAADAAEGSAESAAEAKAGAAKSAEDANRYAQTVNPDEIRAQIAVKADNLEFDTETNLLWLTAGGERIGDGIQVATGTGGGGGGGESNNAVLTLKNTSGWLYKSIAYGAECPVSFEWSSIEDEMPTGSGVLKISVGGAVKHTAQIAQGAHTIDVGEYLGVGANTVKVNVTDTYGNSRSVNYNVTTVSLVLESSFDASVAYSGDIEFPYTPTGSAEKTVYFKMDGSQIGTATVLASGREQKFVIPAQSHGSHIFEVWFTAEIEGETVPSNTLRYDLICTEAGNSTPIIASTFRRTGAEQFESLAIPYIVYDPARLYTEIILRANGADTPLTVDRTEQVWTYRPQDFGTVELAIICGETVKPFTLEVSEASIDVSAETENLSLYLTSYGRSNNEEDPAHWSSGNIQAQLTNFNFVSDGWITDADGITALRVGGDARVQIPLQIFAKDFRTGGKTIEIEFATRDVLDYDSTVISCWSGGRGLKITAQKALIKSEQSEISTQYKEDEHVRLAFVVEKRSAHRLLMIYINGILSGAVQYPADDDFSQNEPVGISIGSDKCTTDIYCIRVYDNDLTRYQLLDNWIADTQVLSTRVERYRHNEVFDAYGQIVIEQLPPDLPYLILRGPALPAYKGNKLPISGQYVDPISAARSFTFTGAEIDVQGTSSAGYERKNYKIKFKGGFNRNGAVSATYELGSGNIPTDTFTFKADVASSEGANNVELAKLYNDASPYRTPPQETDDRVRQGIDGYPIVIFHDAGSGPVFIGKYNFNHDKGTPEVFGFASGDESWETRNNTSGRALWKDPDFSGSAWQNDFEARYPDGSTNVQRLSELAAWIASTDRTADGLTDEEKTARLRKFRDEFEDHLNLDSALFYYLFTELFLLADSRAKNSFPTVYGADKWCWLPYDMDTAIGTNNEGKLAFGYELEDTDHIGSAQIYTGQKSVLWNNLRDAFPEELMAMYQKIRSDKTITYEDTERRFAEHQAKWPAAIFNEDAYYKYLAPLFEKNNGSYLGMLQGSKAEQRKWWLYNRFRYIDSKYNAGDALTDFITLRGYQKSDITVTPYADIYATVKYGSYLVQKRALRGGEYTLKCPVDDLDDTEIYIYSASQIADLGDLSGLMVGYAEFASGTKLQSLTLGSNAEGYSNTNLTQLYLGNNALLKVLDVRNCPNLGSVAADINATASVDLSGCTNIEEVYFDNTAITGAVLPNGGVLKKLHLPATVANLTIRNQPQISEFVMPGYGSITTLRLENVGAAVNGWDILHQIPANSRVRMIGFDWTLDDAEAALNLYDHLDTMRGLDENGNNVDKAQMSGTIHIDSITGAQLAEMQSRYPSITVAYNHIASYLYFYNDDGSQLLHTVACIDGADGAYGGSTPTKTATAQYTYTYAGGWSLTPGGAADANALKNVTTDRNVYAVFTATVRKYTVYWKNGSTTLETDANVPYGTTPTYNGADPVYTGDGDAADYAWSGWSPAVGSITGDTTYTAVFKYSGYVYSTILDGSISGEYVNDTVKNVGAYAFNNCTSLTRVRMAAAEEIGQSAFNKCSKMSSADFSNVSAIVGEYAFSSCSTLVALILRSATVVNLGATNAFSSTPMTKTTGKGYIYVPAALVENYKAATNWSSFEARIRALESYTVDGTITGALDETKI